LPELVLEIARRWADFQPRTGNLDNRHPELRVVLQTEEARQILVETRLEADAEYAKAEAGELAHL
jgi:hypothetical protein